MQEDLDRSRDGKIGVEHNRRQQMQLSRNKAKTQEERLNRSTKCREAIEEVGDFSIDPPGIEELLGLR